MLAMPTSAPRPRRAHRRDEWRNVLTIPTTLVSKIARKVGRSSACSVSAPCEIPALAMTISGAPKRAMKSAAAWASASGPARRRRRPRRDRREGRRQRVEFGAASREHTEDRALRGVLPRERGAQAAAGAGDEDASRMRLQVFGRSARAFATSASISGGIARMRGDAIADELAVDDDQRNRLDLVGLRGSCARD